MIPLIDLGAQYHELKDEINAAIARVFESSQFVLGREVAVFEEEFAAYCHCAHGIGVNSGTSALHLALLAAGIGPGDEVITVPFTFYATVATIDYTGAKPVYVDVDPETFTIAPHQIESRITERTRAILLVHLYGQPAEMDAILDIARRHKLIVIEDAAQAHGAEYKGRRIGSLGDIGCFSFYPSKNLSAAGEGGMAVTNNPEYARRMRTLRDWGQEQRYRPIMKGYNYRLPGLQGAILRVKLRRLEVWNEVRRARAAEYDRLLEGVDVIRPKVLPHARHVYCLYPIRTKERDRVQRELQAAGVQTAVHYPLPIHMREPYADGRYRRGDFPAAEACAESVLSLPMYPHMDKKQVERVCEVLRAITDSRSAPPSPMSKLVWEPDR